MTHDNADTGVVYLAFGYDYCIQTVRSVCSLKSIHPDLNISIVTNVPINNRIGGKITYGGAEVGPELFDEVIYVDDDRENNRQYKTSINQYSPYDRTLFLDCDTIIKQDIKQGFRFLDHADLAAVARPIPSNYMIERWDGDIHLDHLDMKESPTFYSGVFFFETDGAADFFEKWHQNYNQFGYDHDQYSFAHAIFTSEIEFLPLPIIWNTMDTDIQKYTGFDKEFDFQNEMKIHHQNFSSFNRARALRKLEAKIGEEILSVDSERKEELRDRFDEKYSHWSVFKSELEKSRLIKSVYKNLIGNNPIIK